MRNVTTPPWVTATRVSDSGQPVQPSAGAASADPFGPYAVVVNDVEKPLGVRAHVILDTTKRVTFISIDPRQPYADDLAAGLREIAETNPLAVRNAAAALDAHDGVQRPKCIRGRGYTWCNNWHISPFTPCDGPEISVPTPGEHRFPGAVGAHLASAKLQDYACSGEHTAPQVSLYASECLDIDDPAEVLLLADRFAAFAEQLRGLGRQLAEVRRSAPLRVSEVGK